MISRQSSFSKLMMHTLILFRVIMEVIDQLVLAASRLNLTIELNHPERIS